MEKKISPKIASAVLYRQKTSSASDNSDSKTRALLYYNENLKMHKAQNM